MKKMFVALIAVAMFAGIPVSAGHVHAPVHEYKTCTVVQNYGDRVAVCDTSGCYWEFYSDDSDLIRWDIVKCCFVNGKLTNVHYFGHDDWADLEEVEHMYE